MEHTPSSWCLDWDFSVAGSRTSLVAQMAKESACNAGDPGSARGSERPPGKGNGNPLRYSCLENPMDRGAWRATVRGFAKSWTRLSDLPPPGVCVAATPHPAPTSWRQTLSIVISTWGTVPRATGDTLS